MKLHFTSWKLRKRRFSTENLLGKQQILKSKGTKPPCPPSNTCGALTGDKAPVPPFQNPCGRLWHHRGLLLSAVTIRCHDRRIVNATLCRTVGLRGILIENARESHEASKRCAEMFLMHNKRRQLFTARVFPWRCQVFTNLLM